VGVSVSVAVDVMVGVLVIVGVSVGVADSTIGNPLVAVGVTVVVPGVTDPLFTLITTVNSEPKILPFSSPIYQLPV